MASRNGAIAANGSAPSSEIRACSGATFPNSALAIAASATLSSSVGASLASSASRSNAEISPYAITPSRSMTASR